MGSVFEKMLQDLSGQNCKEILEECMGMNVKKIKNRPVRYRLIALGFVAHMSLEQLDQKLQENGCEQLYARELLGSDPMSPGWEIGKLRFSEFKGRYDIIR